MCRRRSRRRRRLPRPHRNKGRTGSNLTARIGVRAAGEGRISGPTPNLLKDFDDDPYPRKAAASFVPRPGPLGGFRRPRRLLRRPVLHCGENHRRLLPPWLSCAPPQAHQCALLRHAERGRAGRLPPLQALQAQPAFARGAPRREDRASLPADRDRRRGAEARRSCRRRGLEPLSLPPHLQAGARRHAEGLRHGASGEPRARGSGKKRNCDRGDLRCRLQLQRPLLRQCFGGSRHDAH